jgi:hypothetical protein
MIGQRLQCWAHFAVDAVHVSLTLRFVISIFIGVLMSFLIYLAGFGILIGGIAWGLIIAGVPTLYVTVASVILLGIGILTGVASTRGKDPA